MKDSTSSGGHEPPAPDDAQPRPRPRWNVDADREPIALTIGQWAILVVLALVFWLGPVVSAVVLCVTGGLRALVWELPMLLIFVVVGRWLIGGFLRRWVEWTRRFEELRDTPSLQWVA